MPAALLAVTNIQLPVEPAIIYAGIAVIGLFAVLAAMDNLTRVISFFRAKPPLHEQYATKKEVKTEVERLITLITADGSDLAEVETRLSSQIGEVKTVQTSMGKELTSIVGQLGEIFGLLGGRSSTRKGH